MSNAISNRNQATWHNTDARESHRAFYEPTHNKRIDIHALNDITERLGIMWDLKRGEGTKDSITESESLIRGHRIDSNSADKSKIPGSLAGGIAETLIYGKENNMTWIWKSTI